MNRIPVRVALLLAVFVWFRLAWAQQSPPALEPSKTRSVLDSLNGLLNKAATSTNAGKASLLSVADLSSEKVTQGLKEALGRGLEQAVATLGKDGGFLTNVNVRIPMPEKLQTIEKTLRRFGQDKMADDFIATMNHAAERAVPAAAGVFGESLKHMTVEDAHSILKGSSDAATQYFRRTAGPQLEEKFRPIVSEATAQAGVTSAYKNLLNRAGFAAAFFNKDSLDLDSYVTTKATDGLFKVVADEERKIRENPVARSSELLRTVFGAIKK